MSTVAEVLKNSGMTDEQIAALDAKVLAGFTGVLNTAETERKAAADLAAKAEAERQAAVAAKEQAELVGRSNTEFYEKSIVPGLTGWDEEKQKLLNEMATEKALAAFYRAQNEAGRTGGFIPTDAPTFKAPEPTVQPRANNGQYVAGVDGTPGSPTFMADIQKRAGDAIGILSDINWKHQQLYGGAPLPISPTELIAKADQLKLDPMTYAARTFRFHEREQEIAQKAKDEERAKIAAEAIAPFEAKVKEADERAKKMVEENDRKWAEKIGSNPDIKIAQPSKFADISRAVKANERPDPLSMNESERRRATGQSIRSEIAESAVA